MAGCRVGGWALVVLGPVLIFAVALADFHHGVLSTDFHLALRAASQIVHGDPVYGAHAPVYYVYPPLYAELLLPFLLLPVQAALWFASLLCLAVFVAGLVSLGVRDPRAIGAALCSAPVVHGIEVANATFLVIGCLALAWRAPVVGAGLAVAVKFIAWPFLFWEAAVRGLRAAVGSILLAAGLILASWTLIGFEGMLGYPGFLGDVSSTQARNGYSLAGAFSDGRWVGAALTILALWRCFSRVRSGDTVGGFAYATLAMLVATPYVYDNYFAFVFLPLALRRPRLSAAWFAPLLLWVNGGGFRPSLEPKVVGWLIFGTLIVWLGEGAPALAVRRLARKPGAWAPGLSAPMPGRREDRR